MSLCSFLFFISKVLYFNVCNSHHPLLIENKTTLPKVCQIEIIKSIDKEEKEALLSREDNSKEEVGSFQTEKKMIKIVCLFLRKSQ